METDSSLGESVGTEGGRQTKSSKYTAEVGYVAVNCDITQSILF